MKMQTVVFTMSDMISLGYGIFCCYLCCLYAWLPQFQKFGSNIMAKGFELDYFFKKKQTW